MSGVVLGMPVWGGKTRYEHQVKGKVERYRRQSVRENSSVVVDQRVSQCRCGSQTTSRQQGIGGLLEAEEGEVGDREKSQEEREEGEENIEKPRQDTTKRLSTSKLETPVKEIKKRSRCSVAALRQARLALSVQCSVRAPVPRWI